MNLFAHHREYISGVHAESHLTLLIFGGKNQENVGLLNCLIFDRSPEFCRSNYPLFIMYDLYTMPCHLVLLGVGPHLHDGVVAENAPGLLDEFGHHYDV